MIVGAEMATGLIRVLGLAFLYWYIFVRWTTADTNTVLQSSPAGDSSQTGNQDDLDALDHPCVVWRTSENNGFHRALSTKIVIQPGEELPGAKQLVDVVLLEALPPGVYIDLHQLASQEHFGGPKVHSAEDIDVERPAHLSKAHNIYVFEKLHSARQRLQANVELPVHLRYQRPSDTSDFVKVILPPPKVLLKGKVSATLSRSVHLAPCDSSGEDVCSWHELQCTYAGGSGQLEFLVPVGREQHSRVVMVVTVLVAVGATTWLTNTVLTKQLHRQQQSKKQH